MREFASLCIHVRACQRECVWVCDRSVMLLATKWFIFLRWRKQFGLKCHYCQERKMRIKKLFRSLHLAKGRRHVGTYAAT